MDCTIRVAKTKALISFAVTAKLICVFVFAYAKIRFSHDAAQFIQDLDFHHCLGDKAYLSFDSAAKKQTKGTQSGLPRSGKKVLKMKFFPGQGKVREFQF